jgi:hypothetical protein
MKKLILLGAMLLAGAGVASADDFSFSLSFGDGPRWRPRPVRYTYVRPLYYSSCGEYRPAYYYRPVYTHYGHRWYPRRSAVVIRSCD